MVSNQFFGNRVNGLRFSEKGANGFFQSVKKSSVERHLKTEVLLTPDAPSRPIFRRNWRLCDRNFDVVRDWNCRVRRRLFPRHVRAFRFSLSCVVRSSGWFVQTGGGDSSHDKFLVGNCLRDVAFLTYSLGKIEREALPENPTWRPYYSPYRDSWDQNFVDIEVHRASYT